MSAVGYLRISCTNLIQRDTNDNTVESRVQETRPQQCPCSLFKVPSSAEDSTNSYSTCIGESAMSSFWHSMAINWSIKAARTQMEQVKLEEFNLKGMKSTEDQSTIYVLIQSFIEQLTLVVK